jgi:hypothetical protein
VDTASIIIKKNINGERETFQNDQRCPLAEPDPVGRAGPLFGRTRPCALSNPSRRVSSLPQRRRLQSPAAPPSPATHAAVSSLPQCRRLQPTTPPYPVSRSAAISSPAAHAAVSSPQSACYGCMKMASPAKLKRLRPSIDSPSKGLNLSWVPEGYALLSSSTFRSGVG